MGTKLGDLLLQSGVLTPAALEQALAAQRADKVKRRLGEVIIDLKLATEDRLLEVLSAALQIPVVDLDAYRPASDALALVSREEAVKALVVPLAVQRSGNHRTLVLVMADPANLELIDRLQFKIGMQVKPLLSTTRQIRVAIQEAYGPPAATATVRGAGRPGYDPDVTWVGRVQTEAALAPAHAVEIHVRGGPRAGARIPLHAGRTLVFGRAPEADFVINDMYLSRRHFQITNSGGSIELLDLGSSNGTQVNGKVTVAAVLRDGDQVQLGRTVLVVGAAARD